MWYLIQVSNKSLNSGSINKPGKPVPKTKFLYEMGIINLGAEIEWDKLGQNFIDWQGGKIFKFKF